MTGRLSKLIKNKQIAVAFLNSTNSLLDHIPLIVGYFNINCPIKLYKKGRCLT